MAVERLARPAPRGLPSRCGARRGLVLQRHGLLICPALHVDGPEMGGEPFQEGADFWAETGGAAALPGPQHVCGPETVGEKA